MYKPLPENATRVDGIKLSPWVADTDGAHCSMRYIEGTDPTDIANRVAFIEKTPRVRFKPATTPVDLSEDWKNWHRGWRGDDGWCEVAQGWCDTHLQAMGYSVPDPKPYSDDML